MGALALVAPVQAIVTLVIFIPALYVLWLSFQSSTYGQAAQFVGLANYSRVLSDPYFWRALINTAVVVLVVVHVELLLGLGMALLFASGLVARPLLLAVVLAPYAVSEVSAVVMWRFLFDPSIGIVTQALLALGLPTLEWAVFPSHGLFIVALLSIWLHLPFTFIILYAARLSVPGELYEAAAIDGASPWARFRRVTLPLLVPAMLIAMLFRYIFAFRLFSEVWLMTGGGPARQTEVLAVYLYNEAFRYNQFGTASATGWLLVIASLGLALFYLRKIYKEMFANAPA
ncbi:sugar ABC transporter permease [Arsenicitalea aurantiaca]|uniref:Sugar ABC transporter permease n=2 Tax=Arsenicitalea aurantiaca TaxID=1783274 RepID=A0A433XM82_9HYPH|nr:sugar ABC transporter permease [Arsenicitalea aurantiaca]